MADAGSEPAIDAVAQLVPATLKALHALEFAGRHLSPASLPQLIEAMAGRDDEVNAALSVSRALDWPGHLAPVRECLEPAAEAAAQGIAGLRDAAAAPHAKQPVARHPLKRRGDGRGGDAQLLGQACADGRLVLFKHFPDGLEVIFL